MYSNIVKHKTITYSTIAVKHKTIMHSNFLQNLNHKSSQLQLPGGLGTSGFFELCLLFVSGSGAAGTSVPMGTSVLLPAVGSVAAGAGHD
jgi:hypothetical protein